MSKPNMVYIFADQLRASSLSLYREKVVDTPNIDRLAGEGTLFTHSFSSCPLCTPYRSMLLTGKYPQTTGHVFNFVRTRHDEVSMADVFKKNGYRTGWVGKWHLHTGSFPTDFGVDYVPEGRDRLGFDYFRAYNFHMNYYNGSVATTRWLVDIWDGYETKGLQKYVKEFVDETVAQQPFCLFLSVHQPHWTGGAFVDDEQMEKIDANMQLPCNVPEAMKDVAAREYRKYLAMVRAVDDMVGDIVSFLKEKNVYDETIIVFTSDHGSMMGAHGEDPWNKNSPFDESIHVPFVLKWPERVKRGTNDTLFGPQDILPTFASLLGFAYPRAVEGKDYSENFTGSSTPAEDNDVFLMNFGGAYNYPQDGNEWRGLRTSQFMYCRKINGEEELYDCTADPCQMTNLADEAAYAPQKQLLSEKMKKHMMALGDEFPHGSEYEGWFDEQRRVIRNAKGLLSDPEGKPDLDF